MGSNIKDTLTVGPVASGMVIPGCNSGYLYKGGDGSLSDQYDGFLDDGMFKGCN